MNDGSILRSKTNENSSSDGGKYCGPSKSRCPSKGKTCYYCKLIERTHQKRI